MYNEFEAPQAAPGWGLGGGAPAAAALRPIRFWPILLCFGGGLAVVVAFYVPFIVIVAQSGVVGFGDPARQLGMLLLMLGVMVGYCGFAAGVVFAMVNLYKAWRLVEPDPRGGMSPGKAVGLLFVPFFSLYWQFRAYYGLSLAYAEFIARRKLDAKAPGKELMGTFSAMPALMLAAWALSLAKPDFTPAAVVFGLFALAYFVVNLLANAQLVRCHNRLAAALAERAAAATAAAQN